MNKFLVPQYSFYKKKMNSFELHIVKVKFKLFLRITGRHMKDDIYNYTHFYPLPVIKVIGQIHVPLV